MGDEWHLTSMTGLGHFRSSGNEIAIEVTVKSFNQRGLEIKYRLSEELSFLEFIFGPIIKKSLNRGYIEVFAKVEFLKDDTSKMVIDEEKVKALMLTLTKLRDQFLEPSTPITMSDLLSLPYVFNEIEHPLKEDEITHLGKEALNNALLDLVSSRKQEGNALKTGLRNSFLVCSSLIEFIDNAQNKDIEKRFTSYKARIEELVKDFSLDQNRLYQEFALLTERSDFREEIDRLKAHILYFDSICQSKEAKGRKMDFLCQEMLRESNTLMSKAFDHTITVKAIELRAEIERIREQVQNIE